MTDQNESVLEKQNGFSRRLFLKSVGSGVASATVSSATVATAALIPTLVHEATASEDATVLGPGLVSFHLDINGTSYAVNAEPRETLLEVLRNRLDLTGSKIVCDHGTCGACTVHLDGKPVYACMTLAIRAQGKKIRTIEGLADGDQLHPVQQAFIEKDALQCGFCTPGFIMSMTSVFEKNPTASLDEVKKGIAGNLCRCGTYTQIFEAAEVLRKRNGG